MEISVLRVMDTLRSVGFSAAYWRELGQRLKPDFDLDAVSADNHCSQDRLEAVVSSWLRDGDLPGGGAWEVLASAVERCRGGGGRNVAAKIRQKVETLGSPDAVGTGMGTDVGATTVPSLTAKPTLNQLHCLRINDVIIGVVQTVAPQWEAVACCLGLPTSSVSIIQRDYKMDAVRGCEKMLREWLDGGEGVRRPLTWATLAEALEETEEFQVLSKDILTNINNLEQ